MKTILAISLLTLTASTALAGKNEITSLSQTVRVLEESSMRILCIDGYKYIITFDSSYNNKGTTPPNIVQMLKDDAGRVMPVRCNE